jgi:glycosyltransferase involved in cell wall biosynthesis
MQELLILGTRGVPAGHGGFEAFTELLSTYLVRNGWSVSVYCQEDDVHEGPIRESIWRGIRRIVVPAPRGGSVGSVSFDWRCARDALRRPGCILVFGYNTAIFNFLFRFNHRALFINMDGLEWKRGKWSPPIKLWFWLNERLATKTGATLIADHPEIEKRLRKIAATARVAMIPYGAPRITSAPTAPIEALGLERDRYFISICRIEPENSVLQIIRAFAARQRRCKLVVLGRLDPAALAYHRAIKEAASAQVIFPGAIYDRETLDSLRHHARAYCHGHQVGGTNPSLVEALGAGNAVIAHDNAFNRWTAGEHQYFFSSEAQCLALFDLLDTEAADNGLTRARAAALQRYENGLTWEQASHQYELLLGESGKC